MAHWNSFEVEKTTFYPNFGAMHPISETCHEHSRRKMAVTIILK